MTAVSASRNQSDMPAFPRSERRLGWWGVLPPIVDGTHRWWLPLSDASLVALSELVSHSLAEPGQINPTVLARLESTLQVDPPLLFYSLSRFGDGKLATISDLAITLSTSALEELAGGDWTLSAPQLTDQHELSWSRLMAQSRSQPAERWIDRVADWLRVSGPQVPPTFVDRFPTVIWDDDVLSTQASAFEETPSAEPPRDRLRGTRLLQRLARQHQSYVATESSLIRLAEQRKNAAARELAYGLSHEINNPLANISARAQQLIRDESQPDRIDSLRQIVRQVFRAHEMIAGLMFFANPPGVSLERLDLNRLIERIEEEFRSLAEEADIRLIAQTCPQAAEVTADPAMLLEALRVLVRNSIEAIGVGGTVVVSIESDGDSLGDSRWLLHVADSGPGLTPQASQHAFDPFYSGREAGRGLGLGLCRAYRVAKLHHATIRLSGGLAGCVATIAIPKALDPSSDL